MDCPLCKAIIKKSKRGSFKLYFLPFLKVFVFWLILIALIIPSSYIFMRIHEAGHIAAAEEEGVPYSHERIGFFTYTYNTVFKGMKIEEEFVVAQDIFCSLNEEVEMKLRKSGIAAELGLLRFLVLIAFFEFVVVLMLASMKDRRKRVISYFLEREPAIFSFLLVNAVLLIMITVGILRLFYYLHFGGGDFFFFCQ
ncbi:MAG: hypothetical protein ABIB71_03260 [Candidatus Woesearchaeota archaeon]